jgi:hypothetical protein
VLDGDPSKAVRASIRPGCIAARPLQLIERATVSALTATVSALTRGMR